MSKRINEINEKYISKVSDARRTISDAQRLSINYFENVKTEKQGHYDIYGDWHIDRFKYQYSGWGLKNTYGEANNDRNNDINSKIAILDSRISFCNSRKNELNEIKADCEESLKNLNEDLTLLQNAHIKFHSIAAKIYNTIKSNQNTVNDVYNIYNCSPKNLSNGTNGAISNANKVVSNSLTNNSISDGVSKIMKFIKQGETIKSGIESIKSQLDERIADLESQKRSFEAMKK